MFTFNCVESPASQKLSMCEDIQRARKYNVNCLLCATAKLVWSVGNIALVAEDPCEE